MMPERPPAIESVFLSIEEAGFVPRRAFRLDKAERSGPLADVRTIALIGVAGRLGWDAFAGSPEAADGAADPLDRFSRRVIGGLAEAFGAIALFPFGGPPYLPFQRWAERAEAVHPSPIGVFVHPVYGLWHSYRGALGLREALAVPPLEPTPSPCESCLDKPCLSTCPVEAHRPRNFNVALCAEHLREAGGADCMARGCRARRACPVGAEHMQGPEQAAFVMRAYLAGLDGYLKRDYAP